MTSKRPKSAARPAEIVREYGPFPGFDNIAGVTFDGESVWFASDDRLQAFDPESGQAGRALAVPADAGTTFDGRYLYQLSQKSIQKLDPRSGELLATLPAPGSGRNAGLTWAEGSLWVAEYEARKIHRIDPADGRVLKTLDCPRSVTGVTFAEGELWYGTWEGDESDLRRADAESGEVLETLTLPRGVGVSGLEANGELFYAGGGKSGKVRAIRRPKAR